MPTDIYTDELKQILTRLRQILNKSNWLTIEALTYQGDFGHRADKSFVEANHKAFQLIADYNRRELLPAMAGLGKYLVKHPTITQLPLIVSLPSDNDEAIETAYAAIAQEWYESVYGSYKVY